MLRKAWIDGLRRAIHGLSRSTRFAHNIYISVRAFVSTHKHTVYLDVHRTKGVFEVSLTMSEVARYLICVMDTVSYETGVCSEDMDTPVLGRST